MRQPTKYATLLVALSLILSFLGALFKIMSYEGANTLLTIGTILFPLAGAWALISIQNRKDPPFEAMFSKGETFLLGAADILHQEGKTLDLDRVRSLTPPPGIDEVRLLEAYILLKDKGMLPEPDSERAIDLLEQLKKERKKR